MGNQNTHESTRHRVREAVEQSSVNIEGEQVQEPSTAANASANRETDSNVATQVENIKDETSSQANPKLGYNLCCVIKAKTKESSTQSESKRSIWFEGKLGGVLKIGSGYDCGLTLKDERCEKTHALIRCKKREENGIVYSDLIIFPCARMYRLTNPQEKNRISLGSVIKLGSISLEVINLNKISSGSDWSSQSFLQAFLLNVYKTEEGFYVKPIETKSLNDLDINQDGEVCDVNDSEKINIENCSCYICWNSLDLTQHKIINEKDNEVIDFSQGSSTDRIETALETLSISTKDETCKTEEPNQEILKETVEETKPDESNSTNEYNPMILNPCLKCRGSCQYVHLRCLLSWIKSSKSGQCSVCNGVLPYSFSARPPNIELKIMRHRRGRRWVGNRRFRLSFAEKSCRSLGGSTQCDITLPDISVSDYHANIYFDREKEEFFVKDTNSKAGTYLQLTEPLVLNNMADSYQLRRSQTNSHYSLVPPGIGFNEFKMGRTNLSIKVVQSKDKKSMFHKLLQRPSLSQSQRMQLSS